MKSTGGNGPVNSITPQVTSTPAQKENSSHTHNTTHTHTHTLTHTHAHTHTHTNTTNVAHARGMIYSKTTGGTTKRPLAVQRAERPEAAEQSAAAAEQSAAAAEEEETGMETGGG